MQQLPMVALFVAALHLSADAAYTPVVVQSKWRACEGYATNLKYITGTNTNYVASWAKNPSKSSLLDKGSHSDLEAACADLLEEGQVGEIYELSDQTGCTEGSPCLRMAVYAWPSTIEILQAKLLVGRVTDAGAQNKWVCGKSAPPPVQPPCPMTCAQAKGAYKASQCCGKPDAIFDLSHAFSPAVTTPDACACAPHGVIYLPSGKMALVRTNGGCIMKGFKQPWCETDNTDQYPWAFCGAGDTSALGEWAATYQGENKCPNAYVIDTGMGDYTVNNTVIVNQTAYDAFMATCQGSDPIICG